MHDIGPHRQNVHTIDLDTHGLYGESYMLIPIRGGSDRRPMSDREVRRLARKSDHKWAHHVALVVRGGVTVALGYNRGELHAEEMAIRKMQMSGERGSRLYSVRIRRDGKIGASKPCAACEKLIRDSGIKDVYYSDYEGREWRLIM